jgi:hypothetical protein
MKKLLILFISFFCVLNIYPQKVNYYEEGTNGADNLRAVANLGKNSGWVHAFGRRYEGIKGTPNLFNSFVTSFLLAKGQEKYIQFDSDIDILRNTLIFMDPSTEKLMELSSDNVTELIYNKYDQEFIFRTTKGIKFDKKIKENKFYQVIQQEPYRLIMITYKTFSKADYEPAFNSGRRYDEFRTERKYFLEDSEGIFHRIILYNMNYEYLIHPSRLNKKVLAKIYPDKKEIIYKEFEEKPDSVSIERIISILNKF